jgi:hypothetical protein
LSSLCAGDFIVERWEIKIEVQLNVTSKNKGRNKNGVIKFQGNIGRQKRS